MANRWDGMSKEQAAFIYDAELFRLQHEAEMEAKREKTPEEKEKERLSAEQDADLDKVLDGLMSKAEYKKKWGIT
ncbi:MAG: hypothetical protein K6A37_08505 [Saccharofermentans sp.]|nr:hypothetical protein [Saccharofermentans sp.]